MKLDFLEDINEYSEHVVRLSDFDAGQAELFRQAIESLINGSDNYADITTLDFIEPVNCTLLLRIADDDDGISTTDNKHFFCDLTISSYRNMIKLVEPFCKKESNGYQWLYDVDTPIDFLFSAGGAW